MWAFFLKLWGTGLLPYLIFPAHVGESEAYHYCSRDIKATQNRSRPEEIVSVQETPPDTEELVLKLKFLVFG